MTEDSPVQVPLDTYPADPSPPSVAPPGRRRPVAIWVAAAVFLLVTTAFVTLWFLERGDHKATVGELGTARTELDGAKSKLANLEKRHVDTEGRIKTANDERQRYEADAAANKPCADAGRELMTGPDEDKSVRAAVRLINLRCQ